MGWLWCRPMVGATGCGRTAGKARVVIATLDGDNITRGDFTEVLRKMTDEDRPFIQNKTDFLNALNSYIDDRVKSSLAKELHNKKKISVSRRISSVAYFESFPEFRVIYEGRDTGESLIETMGVSEGELVALRAEIEFGIDDVEEKLLREKALQYVVDAAVRDGSLESLDEEFQRAFALTGTGLKRLELTEFRATLIPVTRPGDCR